MPDDDQQQLLDEILHQIPGYNPWDQADDAWVDYDAALRAINFFADRLKHVEGSARGEPFILRKWQAAIVGNLFGWKRKDEAGRIVRRYRKAFIMVARGNGKSPLAAGIALYAFFEDDEPGAQCFLAAGQKEQAGVLFRNAAGMVDQDPSLLERVKMFRGKADRCMTMLEDPLSFLKTIPADAAGQHGGIPHVSVVDELHVQESRDLVDVFETGMAKKVRAQPLLAMVTTADYERESICNEVQDHAEKVRDNGGRIDAPGYDPSFLPVIYGLGADDDWKDEALWGRANPNLDVSVSREMLRSAAKKAAENPAFENTFRRLHLNQKTKQEMRVISTQAWDVGATSLPPGITGPADLIGRECYVGIDLASTDDLASASFVFPLPDDWLAVLSFSWCPEARIVRRARQRVPYDVWGSRGYAGGGEDWPHYLTATDGDWIDYDAIEKALVTFSTTFRIKEVGYDPHGASQLMQNLITLGFKVIPIIQSFRSLAGPTKELIRRVGKRKVAHFGNPVLRWAAGNAAAHFDGKLPPGGKIEEHLDKVPMMLSKRKSTDKIDPIAAMVLALARIGEHSQHAGRSVYETRGIRVV